MEIVFQHTVISRLSLDSGNEEDFVRGPRKDRSYLKVFERGPSLQSCGHDVEAHQSGVYEGRLADGHSREFQNPRTSTRQGQATPAWGQAYCMFLGVRSKWDGHHLKCTSL